MQMHMPSVHKKALLIVFVLLVVTGLAYLAIALYKSSPTNNEPTPEVVSVPAAGPITARGTIVCLPHKNTDGPQTLECAYGLKDESGRYFGMSDTDPEYKNISNLTMNTSVTVNGTFKPEESDRYQSIGIIAVTSITAE